MSQDVELKHFSVGTMDNNVYILIDPSSRESVLFDAPTEGDRILRELEGTSLKYILMTHADSDHVQALQQVRQASGALVGAHSAEADRLPAPPDFEIEDGDVLTFGNTELRVLHTPGHSPGGMGFVTGKLVIAGDTLFPGGPGNTKRPDGNFDQIIASIREKLFRLPDDTMVYPGHGASTTIGRERTHLAEWTSRGW